MGGSSGKKRYEEKRTGSLVGSGQVNVDAAPFAIEANLAFDQSEDCVILADSNTLAWKKLCSTLANDDVAGNHMLTAELFNPKTLACTVAPVFD